MRHNSEYLGNIPGIVRTFVNATVYPQHNDKKVEKKKRIPGEHRLCKHSSFSTLSFSR
jgi:hypothetical protein